MSLDINDFKKVGLVNKTHGYHGGLLLFVEDTFPEDPDELDFLFFEIDKGLVPFQLKHFRFKSQSSIIVELEDITSQEQADMLVSCDVYLDEANLDISVDGSDLFSFEGFTLFDETNNEIGQIEEVIPYPNNPVFRLLIDKTELLIPASNELVLEIDVEQKRLVMQLPEGLLDLYLNS